MKHIPLLLLPALVCILFALRSTGAPLPAGEISPDTAIQFLYDRIKKIDYVPLLAVATGPEHRRIKTLIDSIETEPGLARELRRRAGQLTGFTIHQSTVLSNIASICFTWDGVREHASPDAPKKALNLRVHDGCQALLVKIDSRWLFAATRPWIPESERAPAFFQQQAAKKPTGKPAVR